MTNQGVAGIGRKVSVTIEAASRLAGVDVTAIRRWAAIGELAIEPRGDMEVVRLDRVHWLSQSPQPTSTKPARNAGLRDRLGDTIIETPDVSELQGLARDRDAGSPKR